MSHDPATNTDTETEQTSASDAPLVQHKMPFQEQRRVHELLSQETRHHVIQTILGHPEHLPSIAEFDYYISKSRPAIIDQLDRLQSENIVNVYELEEGNRKRDLPYRFYGLTEYGTELLYEYKYLRSVPIMRALTDTTRKPEKIQRHETAPRPNLPEKVATALDYDEPDVDDIDQTVIEDLEDDPLFVEGAHRASEPADVDTTSTEERKPKQDTSALDKLF